MYLIFKQGGIPQEESDALARKEAPSYGGADRKASTCGLSRQAETAAEANEKGATRLGRAPSMVLVPEEVATQVGEADLEAGHGKKIPPKAAAVKPALKVLVVAGAVQALYSSKTC